MDALKSYRLLIHLATNTVTADYRATDEEQLVMMLKRLGHAQHIDHKQNDRQHPHTCFETELKLLMEEYATDAYHRHRSILSDKRICRMLLNLRSIPQQFACSPFLSITHLYKSLATIHGGVSESFPHRPFANTLKQLLSEYVFWALEDLKMLTVTKEVEFPKVRSIISLMSESGSTSLPSEKVVEFHNIAFDGVAEGAYNLSMLKPQFFEIVSKLLVKYFAQDPESDNPLPKMSFMATTSDSWSDQFTDFRKELIKEVAEMIKADGEGYSKSFMTRLYYLLFFDLSKYSRPQLPLLCATSMKFVDKALTTVDGAITEVRNCLYAA